MRILTSCFLNSLYLITVYFVSIPNAVAINIVTTIKPLHSIISNITHNTNDSQLTLLIDQQTSAHHYQLKPDDRLAIANAQQIFWIGPNIETAFSQSFHNNEKAISLLNITDLVQHKIRETHSQHQHDHDDSDEIDPHIWLNTNNAIAIANVVTHQLIKLNNKNAGQYQKNLQSFIAKVNRLDHDLSNQLQSIKQQPFATLHDAFQYFEKQFKLNHVTNISLHPKLPLSGKQRLNINQTISKHKIVCLFYDPAHHPKAAQQLANQQQIQLQALDPIGYKLEQGKNLYFDLLNNLATDISYCLKKQADN